MIISLGDIPSNISDRVDQLSNDITFSQEITKGCNGYVFVGRNRHLERDVVVKFYFWGGGAHVEPARLAQLASEHVLAVYDAASVDNEWAYFITPYCGNGDLDDGLSSHQYGPVEAVDALLQIASGVSYLHGCGYVHRDLKPSNIFVTSDGRLVIGDFGSVAVLGNEGYAATQSAHSLIYRPPEDFVESRFYRQGDIYQLGVLLFQILGGSLPYEERAWLNPRQARSYDELTGWEQQSFAQEIIRTKIRAGAIINPASLPEWVPTRLITVMRRVCRPDRNRRHATVADLISELNNLRGQLHDWRIIEGYPTLQRGSRAYRIVTIENRVAVERRVSAAWRRMHIMQPVTLHEAFQMIEAEAG